MPDRQPTLREQSLAKGIVGVAALIPIVYLAWSVWFFATAILWHSHRGSPEWVIDAAIWGASIATAALGYPIFYGLRRLVLWLWWALTKEPAKEAEFDDL